MATYLPMSSSIWAWDRLVTARIRTVIHVCITLTHQFFYCAMHYREFQQPLFSASVDLKSAFDWLTQSTEPHSGRPWNVSESQVSLWTWSSICTLQQQLEYAGQAAFPHRSWLLQAWGRDCVLDPALFCRAMDFIMNHVSGQPQGW